MVWLKRREQKGLGADMDVMLMLLESRAGYRLKMYDTKTSTVKVITIPIEYFIRYPG